MSGLVKKVGAICALIAAASVFQLMGTMNKVEKDVTVKASKTESHKLQASNESHPASYYDRSSSHYQGGAHNVLINKAKEFQTGVRVVAEEQGNYGHNVLIRAAKEGMGNGSKAKAPIVQGSGNYGHNALISFAQAHTAGEVSSTVTVPSAQSLGGSHNVAMAVIAEQSRNFKKQQSKKQVQGGMSTFFSSLGNRNVSEKQFNKNLRSTAAFVGFMVTLAMCVSFYVTLKTYHAHLQKRDQLMALMKNPNARVAVGKKGKEVVKKLAKKSKALKAEKPKKVVAKADDLEALIEQAKAKKAVSEAKSELLLSGYEAPKIEEEVPQQITIQTVQPTINYQLIEPMVQAKPVLQQPQQQFFYPQNFEVSAPLPVPQMYTQPIAAKVAIQQPEPMREPLPAKKANLADVPKADLIKALMMQLAKEDI